MKLMYILIILLIMIREFRGNEDDVDMTSGHKHIGRQRDKESTTLSKHRHHRRPDTLPHIDKIKRCGGNKHAMMTRPCPLNDTDCGSWDLKDRFWHPIACKYQDITSEDARKCLGNRTLAFIGDSQIRDVAFGVGLFLLGQQLEDSPDSKFDYKGNPESNATRIPPFKEWKENVPGHNYNGYIIPKEEVAKEEGYNWQIQVWNLYCNNFIRDQVDDVLNNLMPSRFKLLRNIDFTFWSHGLHDYGWFDKQPYGQKYFETMVKQWLNLRDKVPVPSVWVSMNPECRPLIKFKISNIDLQATMVEEINWYVNKKMLDMQLPYWDAGAVLRSPQRCNVSDDGVHVKMFVDIMRAKMLFNHLCDEDMNWRGSIQKFM